MKDQIKQNLESYKQFLKYKKENYVEPWRGTGRTTRALFDMSSRYPDGEFVMICHSGPMAKLCFDKFVLMQVTLQAPITVNRSNLSVRLHDARYSFKVDSMHLRCDLMPHVEIFEDHHVQEERSAKLHSAFERDQRYQAELAEQERNEKRTKYYNDSYSSRYKD